MNLESKIAIVTGGSRGIGSAIVRRLANDGATVFFTYRSSSAAADALIEELIPVSDRVYAIQSDAASFEQAESLVKQVVDQVGSVDILVNNAGITQDTLMLRMNEQQWDKVIEVNLKSVFNMSKQVLRPMLKKRSGSIINISSVVGVFGNAGQANYAASKAGILGFTKSIAKELGSRNIRCNAVAPGYIETEMTHTLDDKIKDQFLQNIPLKRMGKSSEVAALVSFLASDESAYINGQVISICGGLNV